MGACTSSPPKDESEPRMPPSRLYASSFDELFLHHRSVYPPILACLQSLQSRKKRGEHVDLFEHVEPSEIKELLSFFEDNETEPDTTALGGFHPSALVSFILQFLEWQSDPLIPRDRYLQFVGCTSKVSFVNPLASSQADVFDRLFFMQCIIVALPRSRFVFLDRLIRTLSYLCSPETGATSHGPSKSAINSTRVGVTLGGLILRPENEKEFEYQHAAMIEQSQRQSVVTFMIDNYTALFQTNPIRQLYQVHGQQQALQGYLVSGGKRVPESMLRAFPEMQKVRKAFENRHDNTIMSRVVGEHTRVRILARHFLAWKKRSGGLKQRTELLNRLEETERALQREREKRLKLEYHLATSGVASTPLALENPSSHHQRIHSESESYSGAFGSYTTVNGAGHPINSEEEDSQSLWVPASPTSYRSSVSAQSPSSKQLSSVPPTHTSSGRPMTSFSFTILEDDLRNLSTSMSEEKGTRQSHPMTTQSERLASA